MNHASNPHPAPDSAPPSGGGIPEPELAHPDRLATLRTPRAWLVFIVLMVLGLATDLTSKYVAFYTIADQPVQVSREHVLEAQRQGVHLGTLIPPHEPVRVIPNLLEFSLVLNPGAVFGIGAGKRWFFITFTLGAMALAVWMFGAWTRPRDLPAHIGIGLLVSGGLGNLYDRLTYACVRDFIHPLPGVRIPGTQRELWPYVSNLADLWLLIGIGLLMWHLWRHGRAEGDRPGTEKSRPA